jgi:hypothetical protein
LAVVGQRIDPDRTAALLGAAYDALGYLDFAGYRVVQADHWLLAGADARTGDVFGRGDGTPTRPGASGYETDKRRRGGADDAVLVAIGENAAGPAHLVCRDLPDGCFVVNAGSVAFTSAIGFDPTVDRIVANVLSRAGVHVDGALHSQ